MPYYLLNYYTLQVHDLVEKMVQTYLEKFLV